jgi:predicted aspartyl protease
MALLVIIAAVLMLAMIGLALKARGCLLALEYIDFPVDQLEKSLRRVENPPKEVKIEGPNEVTVRSLWTWLAMKIYPGAFLIPMRANGVRASFLLDTGAALTTVSPKVAIASQAVLMQRGPTILIEGQEALTYLGRLPTLEIAGLKLHEVPIIVLNKQLVLKILGIPLWSLDGFFGMEPLRHMVISLDYRRGDVSFRRNPSLPGALSADLKLLEREVGGLKGWIPIVEGFVEGAGPFPCFIDTGGSAIAGVGDDLLQQLGWPEVHHISKIQLGDIELKDVPAISGKRGGRSIKGVILIGSGLFQSQGFRRLTLDFLAGKLYAER